MDQDKLNVVLNAVASLFMPIIEQRLKDSIKTLVDDAVQVKIDDLTGLDRTMIQEIARGEIEDMDIDQSISDWMDNNFDINDHESNLDINDRISDWMDSNLTDRVRDEVRDLSFSVTVD